MSTKTETLVRKKTQKKLKKPHYYKVVLLNDDFTPVDFVVLVLEKIFHRSTSEAQRIMKEVHNKGSGVAGVFHYELAETKAHQANSYSQSHQYPLQCVLEKDK